MAFWYKIFNLNYDVVLAVCDKELLGKSLQGDDVKVKVSEYFYKGEIADEEAIVKLMNLSTIGNLMGKRIVSLAEKEGFIGSENVLLIGDVPHAQYVKIQ